MNTGNEFWERILKDHVEMAQTITSIGEGQEDLRPGLLLALRKNRDNESVAERFLLAISLTPDVLTANYFLTRAGFFESEASSDRQPLRLQNLRVLRSLSVTAWYLLATHLAEIGTAAADDIVWLVLSAPQDVKANDDEVREFFSRAVLVTGDNRVTMRDDIKSALLLALDKQVRKDNARLLLTHLTALVPRWMSQADATKNDGDDKARELRADLRQIQEALRCILGVLLASDDKETRALTWRLAAALRIDSAVIASVLGEGQAALLRFVEDRLAQSGAAS